MYLSEKNVMFVKSMTLSHGPSRRRVGQPATSPCWLFYRIQAIAKGLKTDVWIEPQDGMLHGQGPASNMAITCSEVQQEVIQRISQKDMMCVSGFATFGKLISGGAWCWDVAVPSSYDPPGASGRLPRTPEIRHLQQHAALNPPSAPIQSQPPPSGSPTHEQHPNPILQIPIPRTTDRDTEVRCRVHGTLSGQFWRSRKSIYSPQTLG